MIIGLDMGGTHIDAVLISKGKIIHTAKRPIDRKDMFQSIWTTLKELLAKIDPSHIKQINLSTTVSTNAIVERKISSVAMFIQSGPGLPEEFLACGDENIFLSGYIDHRGRVVKALNSDEITSQIQPLKEKNIHACGVVTKFSTRNPNHEKTIQKLLKEDFPVVTMGHTMSGKLNFPRRVFTTYLNAAIYQTFNQFSKHLKQAMEREGLSHIPLYILKADGGTMNLTSAEQMPVETILSGPAASLMGMNAMLPTNKDAILLDIGGTTTDIFFLVDGVPLFEPKGIKINKYKTLVRSIYSYSIGLGGDSAIEIKDGKLAIGPERKGSPMALGGPVPTPTDAMIVLGYLDYGNRENAIRAIGSLAKPLQLSVEEVANMILRQMAQRIHNKATDLLREVNSQPVYTIKELLDGRIVRPQLINLIGGPAKVLAPFLKEAFELPCYFPKNYHVANAVGAALAHTTTEITLEADTVAKTLTVPELGIQQKISEHFTLEMAKERAIELLIDHAQQLGANREAIETEFIEEQSFNVVRGFFTSGKIIRLKAQVKPGITDAFKEGVDLDAQSKK